MGTIAEKLQYLKTAKSNIDAALQNKGVTPPTEFGDYGNAINSIPTGSDDPILVEKTINSNGTYYAADDSADGYNKIIVNVAGSSNKLAQVVDKSVEEITVDDLAGATKIGDYMFQVCSSLTNVAMPNSITEIGKQAFSYCTNLKNIVLSNKVTNIEELAFCDCSHLQTIYIPSSVKSIKKKAFAGCSYLKAVKISDLASWCNILFSSADANPLSIAGLLYLNEEVITDLIIPNSITNIQAQTFTNSRTLKNVTIPDSVVTIGSGAFRYCAALTDVVFSNNLQSIGYAAFLNCIKLTNITIPDSVTSIGELAFSGCTALTNVKIGNGITSIGKTAFGSCQNLQSITIFATIPPTIVSNSFVSTNDCPIYVPAESVDAYKAATNWSTYADRIQAIQE